MERSSNESMAEDSTNGTPNTLSPPSPNGDLLLADNNSWGGRLSRRSSLRASITSIDTAAVHKKEHFQLSVSF